MVEALASGVEDKLIDGLSFKLQPGASYVMDRRSVTYHPQGSNIYTPGAGTKLIRILLTGEDWLDVSTLRVMFRLNNIALPDPAAGGVFPQLRPLGGPWSFFRRMRILAAGQLVEDIDQYNRIHEMMRIFIAKESRTNDAAEAFGQYYDLQRNDYGINNYQGIWPLDAAYVLFKPLSGLLNQNKMLPLRFAPITIELELVDNYLEPILSNFAPQAVPLANQITPANTSFLWSIDNVQCKVDVCTLDNALHNSYVEHLLQGNSLPISYNTFVSQLQTIAGQTDVLINVSRALTRLKSVFVTLQKDRGANINPLLNGRKGWNDFYSPASYDNNDGTLTLKSLGDFEFRLQIGSKIFPEYPIRSHSEAHYQLKKTLGVQASAVHNFDISGLEYRDHKFVLGTDCEKVLDAGFTGINTRAGDLMTVHFKYNCSGALDNTTDERLANRLHIVLHSDQILEVRSSGCQVFD
jgi:hypothetical protein